MNISYKALATAFLSLTIIAAPSAAASQAQDKGKANVSSIRNSQTILEGETYWPVKNIDISATYLQKGPHWSGGVHKGIDFRGPVGTPIHAVQSGFVTKSGYGPSWAGIWIETRSANGALLVYAHLSQTNVQVGDTVKAGKIIGLMGATGNTTGSHLHFEVLVGNENIDPETILKKAEKL